jgi:hypothetical protein
LKSLTHTSDRHTSSLDPTRARIDASPKARRIAVRDALRDCEEAAGRHDYRSASAWLNVVEAIGGEISPEYLAKQRAWAGAIEAERYAGGAAHAASTLAASIHVAGRGALSRLRRQGPPRGGQAPDERTEGSS